MVLNLFTFGYKGEDPILPTENSSFIGFVLSNTADEELAIQGMECDVSLNSDCVCVWQS